MKHLYIIRFFFLATPLYFVFTFTPIYSQDGDIQKNNPVVSEIVQVNNLLLQKTTHLLSLNKLEQNANNGDSEAQFQLALQLRNTKLEQNEANLKEAFQLLETSAGQSGKHAGAQCGLARAYFLGEGTERNIISAYIWATISSAQNTIHKKDAETLRDIVKKHLNQQQIKKAEDISKLLKKQLVKSSA